MASALLGALLLLGGEALSLRANVTSPMQPFPVSLIDAGHASPGVLIKVDGCSAIDTSDTDPPVLSEQESFAFTSDLVEAAHTTDVLPNMIRTWSMYGFTPFNVDTALARVREIAEHNLEIKNQLSKLVLFQRWVDNVTPTMRCHASKVAVLQKAVFAHEVLVAKTHDEVDAKSAEQSKKQAAAQKAVWEAIKARDQARDAVFAQEDATLAVRKAARKAAQARAKITATEQDLQQAALQARLAVREANYAAARAVKQSEAKADAVAAVRARMMADAKVAKAKATQARAAASAMAQQLWAKTATGTLAAKAAAAVANEVAVAAARLQDSDIHER